MAKEYKGIAVLGESLLGQKRERADKRARRNVKREERNVLIGAGLNLFKDLGGKIINQKNDDFLKNENFYSKNAIVDSNIKVAKNYQKQWEDRLTYEGGEEAYFNAQAKAQIEAFPAAEMGKTGRNASEYAAYMYANQNILKANIRRDSEFNYNEATEYLGKLGDNPNEALKNQMLKGRARNTMDHLTLPIVNFFTGNDSRSTTEAISDSVNDPDGLVAEGKVKKEDVQSIFDITANYKTAIQKAEQLEEFRKTFADGMSRLGVGPNVKSEPRDVRVINNFGEERTLTVIDVSTASGTPLMLTDGLGNEIDPAQYGANIKAIKVPKVAIDRIGGQIHSSISKEHRKLMNDYTEHVLGDEPTKEQIAGFQQVEYGKIARTSLVLNKRFGGNEGRMGFTPEMADKMAIQMAVENISQIFTDKGWGEDQYDPSSNLLTASDPFHPYLAIAAYKTLEANNQLPAAFVADGRFLEDLKAVVLDVRNSTVGGQLVENNLAKKLNISIPEEEPSAEQVIENNLKAQQNKKDNTLLILKTIYKGENNPTPTINQRSKNYQSALISVGSLEDNTALIKSAADARINVLEKELLEKDTGMYSARRKALKKAEIKRLTMNPNIILQD